MSDSTINDGVFDETTPVVPEIETADPDVRAAAADPASISIDGVTVANRSVKETIDAERHLQQKSAGNSRAFGLGFRRIIPGSSVGQ
jgi:hypothetical protein